MIIDFHVHCFPDALALKTIPVMAERAKIKARLDGRIKSLKESMIAAKIDYSLLLPIATKANQTKTINNWSASVVGENILSFGTIHPLYSAWEEELERINDLGLKGIKFHPDYQNFYVDDKHLFPLYEKASQLGLIIIFHAGVDIGLKPPYHCYPKQLLKVIESFPQAKIVAAHMGGYACWEQVEKYLLGKNVYFDTSYCLAHMPQEQFLRIINNHDNTKIFFGTDSPWEDQRVEIQRINKLNLKPKVKEAILGTNAQKFLNL